MEEGSGEDDTNTTTPASKRAKLPSGALQVRQGDIVCACCQFRKANGECEWNRCLKCCVASPYTCKSRNHAAQKRQLQQEFKRQHQQQQQKQKGAVLATSLSSPPPHQQRPAQTQHYQSQTAVANIQSKPITTTINKREQDKVYAFLENLHLQQYASVLINNGFDSVAALGSLTRDYWMP